MKSRGLDNEVKGVIDNEVRGLDMQQHVEGVKGSDV